MIERAPFYGVGTIPRTAYEGLEADITTLTVGAIWAVRDSVPEEHRVYGIISCGAATGDDAFADEFLLK